VTCIWKEPWGARPLYYWYYITQCKFHAGGKVWNDWNKQFAPELVKAQKILEGKGPKGEDLGFWESPTEQEAHGGIYNTTLCTLMLEVYYRYLPTYKPPSEVKYDDSEAAQKDDVEVKITL
jgi:hypothetical protein